MDGKVLLWWGLGGVTLGVALPLLMVLDVIEPTFLLALIAFAASVAGLLLGLYGSAMIVRSHRK